MWSFGGTAAGSSREQVVMSISPELRSEEKVSGVPQRGQNVLVPWSDERKLIGSPWVKKKRSSGTENQLTNAAALVRRQTEQ
jgi:hypothetical protein